MKETPIKEALHVMEGMQVGRLALWFDSYDSCSSIYFSPSAQQFMITNTAESLRTSAVLDEVVLHLYNRNSIFSPVQASLLVQNEIWELWLDEAGYFYFANPRQQTPRQVIIDNNFSAGVLLGDFINIGAEPLIALPRELEMVFFVNWLAGFGDCFLHASGFAQDGKGYIFIGPSGIGKSTLVASLKNTPNLMILGEDQILLRFIENQFWVFGTPWHLDPKMCSPAGVPLEAIFFLTRDGAEGFHLLKPVQGVTRLLQNAFIPFYRPAVVEGILERFGFLSERTPFTTFNYRLGEDVLSLIDQYHAL